MESFPINLTMLKRFSWKNQTNEMKKERKIGTSIPYEYRSKESKKNTSSRDSNLSGLLTE